MLRDPAGAAETVQDTFLIAAVRVRRLRDRARFRPWLYAVAGNQCLRRLRAADGRAWRCHTDGRRQASGTGPPSAPG